MPVEARRGGKARMEARGRGQVFLFCPPTDENVRAAAHDPLAGDKPERALSQFARARFIPGAESGDKCAVAEAEETARRHCHHNAMKTS